MNLTKKILLAFAATAFVGCANDPIGGPGPETEPEPQPQPDEPGGTSGGEDNTFEHPGGPDIWDYLERLQEEGPARFSSRLHSCPKMKYSTIGKVLESRGVNVNANGQLSAGFLWREGGSALGAPKLNVRSREKTELTTAAAARLFDIFAQAAPEMIAAMPTLPACTVNGIGAEMFNQSGQCTPEGVACITGAPATVGQLELCNEMVNRASTTEIGQEIAVAALAAAAHTCE